MKTLTAIVVTFAALASCWKSKAPDAPVAATDDLSIEVGAITLGTACPQAAKPTESERQDRSCEPGTLQLSLHSGAQAETIKLQRVEIRDKSGKLVGTLAMQEPTVWTSAGAYEAWDQKIGAGQVMAVSYKLSPLDWSGVAGGAMALYEQTFQATVVIAVGDHERVFEKTIGTAFEGMIET
jgi:hypothetical protein